ncbi:MAG TPA: alpha/beta fold hydrolase [Planctomycetota bacterium]|nr:alpha/beta fold hydrolase [Planctomycetota bacterium]
MQRHRWSQWVVQVAWIGLAWVAPACVSDTAPPEPQRDATQVLRVGSGGLVAERWNPEIEAPTLVFLPGWCETRRFWAPLAEALGSDRWNLVALDLPGHGDSLEIPEADPGEMARAVSDWLVAAQLPHPTLVGHGYGATIALELAALVGTPDLDGVIVLHALYDPTEPLDSGAIEAMAVALEADYAGTIEPFARSLCPSNVPRPVVDWVAKQMLLQHPLAMIAALRGLEGWDLRPALARVHVPVRAINGAYKATRVDRVRKLLPDFQVQVVSWTRGIGYAPMLQDPAACAQALAAAWDSFHPADPR